MNASRPYPAACIAFPEKLTAQPRECRNSLKKLFAQHGVKAATWRGMYQCIELAGFAAAQAVCCLFDRQPLLPLAFARCASRAPTLSVLTARTPDAIAIQGQTWLDANHTGADEAVIAFDGFVTTPAGRKDAVILDLRSYRDRVRQMRMAVPYRPHHDPAGFAVHRPKFIVSAPEGHDVEALQQAFFRGVFAHDTGGRIWTACADQRW
jgi:hypothetical protein